MKIIKTIFILLIIPFLSANAQQILTIEDAINIALKNNYDIKVARNSADISKANNTSGNAGMLPTAQITGSGNYALSTNKDQSSSIASLNAGAELNWTLYDGGKMYVTKNKLNEIQALGDIQFKSMVLETMYSLIATYYDIIRQKQQLISINEVINYNTERVTIAETGFNSGSLVKTDLLLAKIDLNLAKENAINQQYSIRLTKKYLNNLLGVEEEFEVTDSIPLAYTPNKEELYNKLNTTNIDVLVLQKQIEIAKLALKETETLNLPKINLRGAYNLTQIINSDYSADYNRSFGPQIGATLQVPIYTAGETDRKTSIAQLELQSAEYDLQKAKLSIKIELQNTLTTFDNQQSLLAIERENNELAKENFKISLERLRYGQTTSLEVHQAQEEYVQSCTRLVNFEYNLKIAETKLKQLTAEL